ncbi:hypothetical protein [Exiguobacterium sp. s191]|uniref:hypothetical protein n=1 Tax=Exiguobacterium sp. s191 TaxID=2751196 RepID=UPI001BEBD7C4
MKKSILISSLALLAITLSSYSNVKAEEVESAEGTVSAYGVVNPGGNVTSSFSSIMLKNAARAYQYKIADITFPVGTGRFFASKVKSRGPWDYKHAYGTTERYVFGGRTMKGEDLGNMHYGSDWFDQTASYRFNNWLSLLFHPSVRSIRNDSRIKRDWTQFRGNPLFPR